MVAITGLSGASGSGGSFQPGNLIQVEFTAALDDGTPLELAELTRASIYVSGPTFNYQRVIAAQSDVLTQATAIAAGSYSYRFSVPIPQTYLAPLNDTTDLTDGELTGQALLPGTYTVGLELRKDYEVDGEVFRDVGNAHRDFLFGGATVLEPREVVTLENCNACHVELRAHGGNRNQVTNCLLCHTAGSEDRNVAGVAGGTPGTTVEFAVMIHKIHAGATLPSVMGMTTNPDGSRKYDAVPKPYQLVGFNDEIVDFSHVRFPLFPSSLSPMPRDAGYAALTAPQQALENLQRSGPVGCAKCHGDPDGAGPLAAPAQGDRIYTNPTRSACASCHDDWVPHQPYTSNGQTMPAVADDSNCTLCHEPWGAPLAVEDSHRHPLADPAITPGIRFLIDSITDAGGDADGTFDVGETVRLTFRVENDAGTPIAANTLGRVEVVLSGPTTNPQVLDYQRMAPAYFTGPGPYTVDIPDLVYYEPIGTSGGTLQSFATAQAPHWNVTGALTALLRRTGVGASSTLAEPARVTQNYVDVQAGAGAGFANGNYIVIDDGVPGTREYMRVQWVEGDRLWFGSRFRFNYKPNLLIAHAAGATVQVVTTAAVPGASWSLNAATGEIIELVEFGAGEILANYTTSFRIPAVYPGALDDSPTRGENWGDWTGLALLDGTYTLDLHGGRSFTHVAYGESNSYAEGARPTTAQLLFGSATVPETVERVVGASACNSCHDDVAFHGGNRRGFDSCIQCHGAAGTENTQPYESLTPASGPIASLEFRNFLHAAHAGVFPAQPSGVQDCAACHGSGNEAWKVPAPRMHPDQTVPTRAWYVSCSSCHDSTDAVAHIDVNTSQYGYESCGVCHGPGRDYAVERSHFLR
ncbi:MAG: hypothetical protein JNK02_12190 [Planctomycetes bacterium]|nr:hypothetical protein [Planctomycetota bacterium]